MSLRFLKYLGKSLFDAGVRGLTVMYIFKIDKDMEQEE